MTTFVNRARMTTATTGTGTITLGAAVSGFLSFAAAGLTNGQTIGYVIEQGTSFEIGTGVYTSSGTTLTRNVIATHLGLTSTPISLSGSAVVYVNINAADAISWDAAAAEVTAARLGQSALSTIMEYAVVAASGMVGDFISGRWYQNARDGEGAGTNTLAADRFDVTPFISPKNLTIDQIAVECSTAVASSLAKIQVYERGSNQFPDTLLFESADLDCSTTGAKSISFSHTFLAGRVYWLGIRTSAAQTLRSINAGGSFNLGRGSSAAGASNDSLLRRSLAYATAAPSSFSFVTADLSNGTPTRFGLRAA